MPLVYGLRTVHTTRLDINLRRHHEYRFDWAGRKGAGLVCRDAVFNAASRNDTGAVTNWGSGVRQRPRSGCIVRPAAGHRRRDAGTTGFARASRTCGLEGLIAMVRSIEPARSSSGIRAALDWMLCLASTFFEASSSEFSRRVVRNACDQVTDRCRRITGQWPLWECRDGTMRR